jgi:hypothetical protein
MHISLFAMKPFPGGSLSRTVYPLTLLRNVVAKGDTRLFNMDGKGVVLSAYRLEVFDWDKEAVVLLSRNTQGFLSSNQGRTA